MDDLLSLPGVGRKSANVIRAHAFSKPAVIVDTHFSRVVGRLGLTDKKEPEKIEREIALICPAEIQSDFSMVINIHGRNVCTARRPECGLCAVRKLCLFPVMIDFHFSLVTEFSFLTLLRYSVSFSNLRAVSGDIICSSLQAVESASSSESRTVCSRKSARILWRFNTDFAMFSPLSVSRRGDVFRIRYSPSV